MARDQSSSFSQISKRVRSVPVTQRAVVQRLSRRLEADGKVLKKARGAYAADALGDYFVLRNGSVINHHVDLEAFARESGALAEYEQLIEG
jgi:hypothetical protein